ncbi:MAG: biopolymer transporter ExbD [Bdellovibrionaceae bacterium]|nr:biopolymer transporter ExbD [Bdellovibrio sp.]
MAHISTGGRGREPNVELNLVPVIDLMSVLITFLLISAVWTQVSMIQLGASFASPKDASQKDITPPPMEDLVLKLDIRANGYILYIGKEVRTLPMLNGVYDKESLLAELTKVKQMFPTKGGVKMAISDEIQYEHVVAAMDIGLKAGFSPELLTGGPN